MTRDGAWQGPSPKPSDQSSGCRQGCQYGLLILQKIISLCLSKTVGDCLGSEGTLCLRRVVETLFDLTGVESQWWANAMGSWALLVVHLAFLFLGIGAYAFLQVRYVLTFASPLSP